MALPPLNNKRIHYMIYVGNLSRLMKDIYILQHIEVAVDLNFTKICANNELVKTAICCINRPI